jgi:TPR repeat protein
MARMMRPGAFAAGVLLAFAVLAGAARAQEAGQAQALRVASFTCNPALFGVLPGDFNFCLALKQWDKGHLKQAIELMELASGWGNKSAQTALGVAYFNGDGIAQDRALGLAWLALAAERQAPKASGLYLSARARVDVAEYERAQGLYGQMRAKYADEVAAARADRHFQRAMRALASNPVYGAGTCLAGFNAYEFASPNDQGAMVRGCSMGSEQAMREALQQRYDRYFAGWKGRVTVGPVESLKAPAKP